MAKVKVLFLSTKHIDTKKDWSGIPYYMHLILQRIYNVEYVAGPKLPFVFRIGYYFSRFYQIIFGRKYIFEYGLLVSWLYGRYYSRIIRKMGAYKFIFVPAGLSEIAFLKTTIPIVSAGDCSVLQLINYYPTLKSVSSLSSKEIARVEKKALEKTMVSILSSSWASDFIADQYKKDSSIVPFGANINSGRSGVVKTLDQSVCRLLFIGVDWERKGGSVAIRILQKLLSLNVNCRLTILGCRPPNDYVLEQGVDVIPYFNKDSKEGEIIFMNALADADFFVLPTKADCTPIVIAEAFSMGLPVLASDTGGLPCMVEEGVTGFLFPIGDVNGYVSKIMELRNNPNQFSVLSSNCLSAYKNEFNWETWGDQIQKLIEAKLN